MYDPAPILIATPRSKKEQAQWRENAAQPKWKQDGYDNAGEWAQAIVAFCFRRKSSECSRPNNKDHEWSAYQHLDEK